MVQLIAHLVGDYVLQNHWIANHKTSSTWVAMLHAVMYGLPFLLLTRSPAALAVIVVTHLVIDRWRLARVWCEWWGVGYWPSRVLEWRHTERHTNHDTAEALPITPLVREDPPPFLAVWLLILADNTAHLAVNYSAIRWLP